MGFVNIVPDEEDIERMVRTLQLHKPLPQWVKDEALSWADTASEAVEALEIAGVTVEKRDLDSLRKMFAMWTDIGIGIGFQIAIYAKHHGWQTEEGR